MANSFDVADSAIEETSSVIKFGLRYRPYVFLVLAIIVIIGGLCGANLYFNYLSSKEQYAVTANTMSEQNKIIDNGFKQNHEDFQKQLEASQKIINYLKYGRKAVDD